MFTTKLPFDLSFGSGVKKAPGMKYAERRSQKTVKLQKGEFFPYLEKKDLLLSYPFQSMSAFVEYLYEAADDPDVVSIRITLYRLSASSKVAAALAYAADRGRACSAFWSCAPGLMSRIILTIPRCSKTPDVRSFTACRR